MVVIMADPIEKVNLDQLTKRAVRAFWMDGLWELALVGALLTTGIWGIFYVHFVAFPVSTWPFLQEWGRDSVWLGLLILIAALAIYIWGAWIVVKKLKRAWISPYVGHAQHKFFMPVEDKVYLWYFLLYLAGVGLLYGFFALVKGGVYVMSVPFIISPAAALWVVGRKYAIRRYEWFAAIGLLLSVLLELLLTWPASYQHGPQNFLNVRPEWGSPALPCFVWSIIFLVSGLIGLITIRRGSHET
jgi:hypothetical protein